MPWRRGSVIKDKQAKIKVGHFIGPPFPLTAGIPQGSSISLTLYTIYTRDLREPVHGCLNLQYADDTTQIITYPGASRNFMAARTVFETGRINNYEKTWKIKTNKNKLRSILIAVKKTSDVIIEGNKTDLPQKGKILGLTTNRSDISKHIENLIYKRKAAITELYRFRSPPTKVKLHLMKAFIAPIITYPAIPLVTISKVNSKKLQTIQNKELRFAFNEKYPYTRNS